MVSVSDASGKSPVLIVGAGMGGLALALGLARVGMRATVLEAREEAAVVTEGVFLTLAPNGMNALRALGAFPAVRAAGIETLGIEIRNGRGRLLNFADQRDHEAVFGAPSVTLGRGTLAARLIGAARAAGVDIQFGRRVVGLERNGGTVTLRCDDGAAHSAPLVVAADGLRSRVRALAFPDCPAPVYTGLIGTGGMVDAGLRETGGVMRMTFGDRAFFGYLQPPGGPAFWFNSYPAAETETGHIADPEAYARHIAALHVTDPEPNGRILAAVTAIERHYPVYDMPGLPHWHEGGIVLLGDAAHAVGPHTGQGASMAIEDGVVLSACLAAGPSLGDALVRYEQLRRPRVAEVQRVTRRIGGQKRANGRLAVAIRDLILPVVIPLGIKAGRRFFSLRLDLDPLRAP